jgi:hypothetical protein
MALTGAGAATATSGQHAWASPPAGAVISPPEFAPATGAKTTAAKTTGAKTTGAKTTAAGRTSAEAHT